MSIPYVLCGVTTLATSEALGAGAAACACTLDTNKSAAIAWIMIDSPDMVSLNFGRWQWLLSVCSGMHSVKMEI